MRRLNEEKVRDFLKALGDDELPVSEILPDEENQYHLRLSPEQVKWHYEQEQKKERRRLFWENFLDRGKSWAVLIAFYGVAVAFIWAVFHFWPASSHDDSGDDMTDEEWFTQLQILSDENFPLLPETHHVVDEDGKSPDQVLEEEMRKAKPN